MSDRQSMLKRMMDTWDLTFEYLESFLAGFPNQLQALTKYVEGVDATGCSLNAHSVKGAAAAPGADVQQRAAARMETAADEAEFERVRHVVAELQSAFAEFERVVEEDVWTQQEGFANVMSAALGKGDERCN